MEIEEFLEERIQDVEVRVVGLSLEYFLPLKIILKNLREAIEWHENWPILVQGQMDYDTMAGDSTDKLTVKVTQQIAWVTNDEYRKRFGDEPPTAPLLRLWAMNWRTHPDFQEEWVIQ